MVCVDFSFRGVVRVKCSEAQECTSSGRHQTGLRSGYKNSWSLLFLLYT